MASSLCFLRSTACSTSSPGAAPRTLAVSAVGALTLGALGVGAFTPASAAIAPASISGKVVGPGGVPLEDISVRVENTVAPIGQPSFDSTGPDGSYSIPSLAAGSYQVTFSDNIGGYDFEYYFNAADTTTDTEVALVAGQSAVLNTEELAASPAQPDPAGTDLSGVVTNAAGTPLAGIAVSAADTPASGFNFDTPDSDTTDRLGRYFLTDLDPASTGTTEDSYKLAFSDTTYQDNASLNYLFSWAGDQQTYKKATAVTIPAGGSVAVNKVLQVSGGISGKLNSPAGKTAFGSFVTAFDSDSEPVAGAEVRPDGTYHLSGLTTGDYRVRFSGYEEAGAAVNDDPVAFIPTWFENGNSFATAVDVKVTQGAFTPDVSTTLGDTLVTLEDPTLTGDPLVGKTLSADPGVWSLNGGSVFTYEWLQGTTVLATGPTYTLTKALAGKKLSLRVTNVNGDRTGIDATKPVTVKYGSKTKATAKAKAGDVTLKIKVKAKGLKAKKVAGKVVVKDGKQKLKGKLKVKKGTLVLKINNPTKGKHTYTVDFKGSGKIAASDDKVSVKIK